MKKFILSQGYEALVDDKDYEALSHLKWHVHFSKGLPYAATHLAGSDGKKKSTPSYLHRVLLAAQAGIQVDHRNGNTLDCKRDNLRLCSRTENARNRRNSTPHSSLFKGVHWHTKAAKWTARISVNNKNLYLGLFSKEEDAAQAYDAAATAYHGSYARRNCDS